MRSDIQTKLNKSSQAERRVPSFRIPQGRELSITKASLTLLGQPQNIQFWFSKSNNALLLGVADEPSPWSFQVGEYCYAPKWQMRIRKTAFIEAVLQCAGWNSRNTYIVDGEYIGSLDMIAFCLDNVKTEEEMKNV